MWKKYIGIPFKHRGRDFNGTDCWGIVTLIYKTELDIDLWSVEDYKYNWDRENYFLSNYYKQWDKIDIPELSIYDVILFNTTNVDIPTHIGLYIGDNKFIHCMENMPVGISTLNNKWKKILHSTYRFKGDS